MTPASPTFATPGSCSVNASVAGAGRSGRPAAVLRAGVRRPAQFGDPSVPGESLRTQFEQTNGAESRATSTSTLHGGAGRGERRVRVVEIGRTLLGRPINMFVIGYPTPLPSRR